MPAALVSAGAVLLFWVLTDWGYLPLVAGNRVLGVLGVSMLTERRLSEADKEAAIAVAKILGLLVARYPVRVEVTDAMRPLAIVCAQLVADGVAKVVDESVTYADPAE